MSKIAGVLGLAVSALLLGALPAAAAEWTVDCMWDKTPATPKATFIAERQMGKRSTALDNLDENVLEHIALACGGTEAESATMMKAYVTYITLRGAYSELEARYGVKPTDILREWNALPADQRAQYSKLRAEDAPSSESIPLYQSLGDRVFTKLNIEDPEAGLPMGAAIRSLGTLEGMKRGGLSAP